MAENNPANDVTFDCKYVTPESEFIRYVFRITGGSLHFTFLSLPIQYNFVLFGSAIKGVVGRSLLSIRYNYVLHGEGVIEHVRHNWVGWSKIGEASFVLDSVNDAGFRPLEWKGKVWAIKPLGKNAVVYGSGGITLMIPAASPYATFAFRQVLPIGLLSKNSVCGSDTVHYFIDSKAQLWKLEAERLSYLNFSEYLSALVDPVMHYDSFIRHTFISDSLRGFTVADDKLGDGYASLSGYVYEVGELRVSTPTTLERHPLLLVTDILDFGRRSQKTVTNVQVGADAPELLYIAYDYRYKQTEPWCTTHWQQLNKEGIAYLVCAGIEFRIKVRALEQCERVEVDYLNISFKTTDQRYSRSAYVAALGTSAFAGQVGTRANTATPRAD